MSDQAEQAQDVDWQRTCEECGTELVTVQVDFAEADFSEGRTGTPLARDVCPNPDCPRHDADLLGADGGDAPIAEDPIRNRPGSLGGDNGGG